MTAVSQYSDVEYVFEPHSNTLPNVREYMKALWDRRHFMRELASADLRALQSGKVLGNLWSVLNPLYQAAIYYFLYAVLRPGSNQAFLPILIPNFFLFFGLSMAAMSDGGSSVKRGRGLMLNSAFPRALLPITAVYKSLRLFVPAACVLAVIYPLVGGRPGPGFFVLPLLFAIQVVMNIGIALAVSTYEVLVPDGTDLVQWLTRLLFFATGGQGHPPVPAAVPALRRVPGDLRRRDAQPCPGAPGGPVGGGPLGDRRSRVSQARARVRALSVRSVNPARGDCTSG
jgi:teichoic acid transport system permease protein